MRTILLTYDDKDFDEIEKIKKTTGESWERFIMIAVKTYQKGEL